MMLNEQISSLSNFLLKQASSQFLNASSSLQGRKILEDKATCWTFQSRFPYSDVWQKCSKDKDTRHDSSNKRPKGSCSLPHRSREQARLLTLACDWAVQKNKTRKLDCQLHSESTGHGHGQHSSALYADDRH